GRVQLFRQTGPALPLEPTILLFVGKRPWTVARRLERAAVWIGEGQLGDLIVAALLVDLEHRHGVLAAGQWAARRVARAAGAANGQNLWTSTAHHPHQPSTGDAQGLTHLARRHIRPGP